MTALPALLAAPLALLLFGCDSISFDTAKKEEVKRIEEAKVMIKDMLLDGESAQFSDLNYYKATNSVCGNVNGKNTFGGYVGKKPFVASLEKKSAMIDVDVPVPEAPRPPTYTSFASTLQYMTDSEKWQDKMRDSVAAKTLFKKLTSEYCMAK